MKKFLIFLLSILKTHQSNSKLSTLNTAISEAIVCTTDTVITNSKQYTQFFIQAQTAKHAPYIKEIKDSVVNNK